MQLGMIGLGWMEDFRQALTEGVPFGWAAAAWPP